MDTVLDWIKKQGEKVKEGVKDGWERVNEQVDKYIWDTSTNEAALEGFVRDTLGIPDQEAKGFLEEGVEKIADVSEDIVNKGEEFIDKASETIKETTEKIVEKTKTIYNTTANTIKETVGDIINNIKVVLDNVKLSLGVGLETALFALSELPLEITTFTDFFVKLFTIDEKTYVDDSIKVIRLQKNLQEELAKRGV